MKFLLLILVLILPSTVIGETTFNKEGIELNIKVHLFESKSEMHKTLLDLGYKGLRYSNEGITLVYKQSDKCEIFAVKPKELNDKGVTVLGHELLHCIYGEYHSNDVKR